MITKGIIFSAPMVRALLAGRKTQTRRLLSPAPVWEPEALIEGFSFAPGWYWRGLSRFREETFGAAVVETGLLPYAPGDRLYVREAWHAARSLDRTPPRDIPLDADIEHAATARSYAEIGLKGRLRPGMHMPRWASRLWLEVSEVRVQRLQGISEADAIAEGIDEPAIAHFGNPIKAYAALWDHLHGGESDHGWTANPWIVALTWPEVNHGSIDQVAA